MPVITEPSGARPQLVTSIEAPSVQPTPPRPAYPPYPPIVPRPRALRAVLVPTVVAGLLIAAAIGGSALVGAPLGAAVAVMAVLIATGATLITITR